MATQQELIQKLIQLLDIQLYSLIITFIVVSIFILLLKTIIEGAVGWILFRIDSYVGIGTSVEVYGKKGEIRTVNWSVIVIESECGYIRIPMKAWRASKYIILKTKVIVDRRKGKK